MAEQNIGKQRPLPAKLLLALTLAYMVFVQFNTISYFKIIQWDESRLAVNAAEMSANGNWLVTTFENQPDLYNTKPPLMIWLQTICIHLFGLNETAIRLPSALAGVLCILLLGRLIDRRTQNLYYAAWGMLLLTVSGGFIQLHGTMTGDFDALLSLFVFLGFDAFDLYLETKDKRYLNRLGLWQALAILCKSAAGFIPLPIWVILLLVNRDFKTLPRLLLTLSLSLLPFILYIFIRESASSGYLQAIWDNDFHGRFSRALEGHTSEWHYYIVNLFTFRFSYLIWLLPVALLYAGFSKNKGLRYYALSFGLYLLLLTAAKTRIHWYDMPLLPLLTVVLTLFAFDISTRIRQKSLNTAYTVLLFLAIIPALVGKYRFARYNEGLLLDQGHYELSRLMEAHTGKAQYIANWYDAEFYFYTKTHPNIRRGDFHKLQSGDTVLMGNLYKDSLPIYYHYKVLKETGNARVVVIE